MHCSEIDWRHSWISRVLAALDRALVGLEAEFDDGLDLLERAESLVGLGYVAIQVYIHGAAADLAKLFPGRCPVPRKLRSSKSPLANNADVTCVECIWAAANYFKHHDAWHNWEADCHRGTLSALKRLGISKKTAFPCVEVLRRLQGDDWRLAPLLHVARSWRKSWLMKLKDAVP